MILTELQTRMGQPELTLFVFEKDVLLNAVFSRKLREVGLICSKVFDFIKPDYIPKLSQCLSIAFRMVYYERFFQSLFPLWIKAWEQKAYEQWCNGKEIRKIRQNISCNLRDIFVNARNIDVTAESDVTQWMILSFVNSGLLEILSFVMYQQKGVLNRSKITNKHMKLGTCLLNKAVMYPKMFDYLS